MAAAIFVLLFSRSNKDVFKIDLGQYSIDQVYLLSALALLLLDARRTVLALWGVGSRNRIE
jgi:hypothetical protein